MHTFLCRVHHLSRICQGLVLAYQAATRFSFLLPTARTVLTLVCGPQDRWTALLLLQKQQSLSTFPSLPREEKSLITAWLSLSSSLDLSSNSNSSESHSWTIPCKMASTHTVFLLAFSFFPMFKTRMYYMREGHSRKSCKMALKYKLALV